MSMTNLLLQQFSTKFNGTQTEKSVPKDVQIVLIKKEEVTSQYEKKEEKEGNEERSAVQYSINQKDSVVQCSVDQEDIVVQYNADQEDHTVPYNVDQDDSAMQSNADQEDSSPSDYECSLREENIRLKSKLEKVKEGMITLEKQCKNTKEDIEKEKKFGDKANSTICLLMQDKQILMEKLKISSPTINSIHTEGIEEVVTKLEQEILVLEERLDSQRKRYHQEHLVMYNDLKEERCKRQEWKHTYLTSQLAVMTFRRKLFSMKNRVSEDDIRELSKCLELVFHDADGRLKTNLLSKAEQGCLESGNSKYEALINSTYNLKNKEIPQGIEKGQPKGIDNYTTARLQGIEGQSKQNVVSDTGTIAIDNDVQQNSPKVYIIDDENDHDDRSEQENEKLTEPNLCSPHINNNTARLSDASKKHLLEDSNSQYRKWRNYSIEIPAHNLGRKPENLPETRKELCTDASDLPSKKSLVGALQRLHDKGKFSKCNDNNQIELNVNDTKFLDLSCFNGAYIKKTNDGNNPIPAKLPKLVEQRNGIRNNDLLSPKKDEKKFFCLTCDKEVPSKSSCGHTSIIVQEKEREFPCPSCGRIFMNRSHLKRHNMIHSGEKPFACSYCEKRFNRKSHLSRHLLTHTGEKPFKCPTCDKGFADNSDLKRHKQIHELSPNLVPILPKDPTSAASSGTSFAQISPINPNTPTGTMVQVMTYNDINSGSKVQAATIQLNTIQPKTMIATTLTRQTILSPSVQPIAIAPSSVQPSLSPSLQPIAITTHNVPKIPIAPVSSLSRIGPAPSVGTPSGITLIKKKMLTCNKCGKTFSRKSHLTRHKQTHDQIKIYCDCGRLFRQHAHYQAHYPKCKRKRDEIEAKYLAQASDTTIKSDQTSIQPSSDQPLDTASNDPLVNAAESESLTISNVKSVNDFRAHLEAKFSDIGVVTFAKSNLIGSEDIGNSDQVKRDEEMKYDCNEDSNEPCSVESDHFIRETNSQGALTYQEDTRLLKDPTAQSLSTLLCANDVVTETLLNGNGEDENVFAISSDVHPNDKVSVQDIPDINFNIIVKNSSAMTSTEDVRLSTTSYTHQPGEVPLLLSE